eukprot:g37650.t1
MVTVADIKEFEDKYKGSEEEMTDIKQAYLDFEGDMDGIMESVLCSTLEDESRIRAILETAIEAQELPAYTAFTKETASKQRARKRRGDREAKEAEGVRQKLGLEDGSDSLKLLIQKKQKDREKQMDNFLAAMEAKQSERNLAKFIAKTYFSGKVSYEENSEAAERYRHVRLPIRLPISLRFSIESDLSLSNISLYLNRSRPSN